MISPCIFFIFLNFWYLGCYEGKRAKISPKCKNNYFCHTPYLRNSTAFDHNFWYTFVKWYLQVFFFPFFIFMKFLFLGLLRVGGVKGKKNGPKLQKILSHFISQELYSYDCGFRYTCVKWWYLQQIFSFFQKSLISLVFQNSLINSKRKFWFVSHLPHMCVILFVKLWLILSQLKLSRTELPKCTQIS